MIGNWRLLLAIPAIAGLAIMGATGASAAPVHQAAHARALTATSRGADPWEWENGNGLWITGSVHGEPLVGSDSGGYPYMIYPQSTAKGWYAISPGAGLCWNTVPTDNETITIDSCPANDENEFFYIPSNGQTDWIIYYLLAPNGKELCVTGEGNGADLRLEYCGAYTNRQDWTTKNVTT
jgi:hypothetical protein